MTSLQHVCLHHHVQWPFPPTLLSETVVQRAHACSAVRLYKTPCSAQLLWFASVNPVPGHEKLLCLLNTHSQSQLLHCKHHVPAWQLSIGCRIPYICTYQYSLLGFYFNSSCGLKLILFKGLFLGLLFPLSFFPPLKRIQRDKLIWKGVDAITVAIISSVVLTIAWNSAAETNMNQVTVSKISRVLKQLRRSHSQCCLSEVCTEYLLHASILKVKQKACQKQMSLVNIRSITQSKDISWRKQ